MAANFPERERPIAPQDSLLKFAIFNRLRARLFILLLAFFGAVAGLLGPFFQKIFIDRLLGGPPTGELAHIAEWFYARPPMLLIVLAFLCTMAAQAFSLLSKYFSIKEAVHYQKDVGVSLFKKTLSIRSDTMGSTTVGEIVSNYATDVPGSGALLDETLPASGNIIFPVLFAPIAIHLLCGFDLSSIIFVMIGVMAVNLTLATRQSRFFIKFKQLAAERTGLVNEWVQNIRLLRILGWMESFESRIFAKRIEETTNRISMVTNGQMMNSFGSSISYFVNLAGVATLVFLSGRSPQPGELFALLWVFGVFLARPFRQVPWLVTLGLDALTSMKRLQKFFDRESSAGGIGAQQNDRDPKPAAMPLTVRGLNLEIGGQKILRDIDFDVAAGELVAIVGEVGCGKSSLVLSLVGETGAKFETFKIGEVNALDLDVNERRSYFGFVPQEGFVMSASLRENIAFRYETEREYDPGIVSSLELSQLRLVNEQMAQGLDTEIGERGVNLSGGQRQRVSLARAHHFDRPIVLLDDCLSAVDVDTEQQLLKDLIDGAWHDRTRLLVTHRLSVLALVDRVMFMEEGRIADVGPFEELMEKSPRMQAFVASVKRGEQSLNAMPKPAGDITESAEVLTEMERGPDGEAEQVS